MTNKYKNTLVLALQGLISVERGALPTEEQLHALQVAVWSWMDNADDIIPTELHKQGSAIKREQASKFKAKETSLHVFALMKKNKISMTKATQQLPDVSERTAMTRLNKSTIKNQEDADWHNALKNTVLEALQKKP